MIREFKVPADINEALTRLGALTADINVIKRHLENDNKTKEGVRLDKQQYDAWREKATYALSIKDAEVRFLNIYINMDRDERITSSIWALLWVTKHIIAEHGNDIPVSDVETVNKIIEDLERRL